MSLISLPNTFVAHTKLLASRLNADFAAILAVVNGGLTEVNFSPTTQIPASLIAPDGGLNPATIGALSIGIDKLAVGDAIHAAVGASVNANLAISTVELAVVTLPAMTTRGGRVVLAGGIAASLAMSIVSGAHTLTLRVYRGALVTATFQFPIGPGDLVVPIPTPLVFDLPPAGTYVYKVTAQTDTASAQVQTGASFTGFYYGVEFA